MPKKSSRVYLRSFFMFFSPGKSCSGHRQVPWRFRSVCADIGLRDRASCRCLGRAPNSACRMHGYIRRKHRVLEFQSRKFPGPSGGSSSSSSSRGEVVGLQVLRSTGRWFLGGRPRSNIDTLQWLLRARSHPSARFYGSPTPPQLPFFVWLRSSSPLRERGTPWSAASAEAAA